jgi:cytochrome c oxidase assembly factor CtaG
MNMVVSHWSADIAVLAGCLVIAAVHLAGVRGMMADARRAGPAAPAGLVREVIAFDAGLAVVLLALVSPVAYWSRDFIWVRSLQDLLLAVVAPPLIVLGAPWLPLRRGLSPRRGGPVPASVAKRSAGGWLSWPVAVTAAFTVAWCGWHVPVLYDAAVR